MKHLLFFFSFLATFAIQAQQIPNGSFENWVQVASGEEPANWGEFTTQFYYDLGLSIDGLIVKSEDAYTGSYAMELRSKEITLLGATETVPGFALLNLKNADLDHARMHINSNLLSLSGYIKQDVAGLDTSSIVVYVYLGDSLTGLGAQAFHASTVDYTEFDIPIIYFGPKAGDSVEVWIQVGGNIPGNVMLTDDLAFNYETPPTAILEETNSSEMIAYPNPFYDKLSIELKLSTSKEFTIYSTRGELVMFGNLNSDINTIDLSNLPPNIYFLKIEDQTIKLVKQH